MKDFDTKALKVFSLKNLNGYEAKITNFGGKLMSLIMPDKNGNCGDIVLGYSSPEEYIEGNDYFGAVIGRYANRISNGTFRLDGQVFNLDQNIPSIHLHGGANGFHNRLWNVVKYDEAEATLILSLTASNNDDGYPGTVITSVKFVLTENNEFTVEFYAICDSKTIINLTYHPFFNLKDGGRSSIDDHSLKIYASKYTPADAESITTGEIHELMNTPLDFSQTKKIGKDIHQNFDQLINGNGYDHNYCLDKEDSFGIAAEVFEGTSGRKMEVYCTQPGLQFYSGNYLDDSDIGKGNVTYGKKSAFCLEPQNYPDAINKSHFPSPILEEGQEYYSKIIYKLIVES